MYTTSHRGFTLLIAVVLSSVALSIGLALLDIAYKQVVLASTAKQSQNAFYAADSVLECALYWDQQSDAFNYTTPLASGSITCNSGLPITSYTTSQAGGTRTTTFTVPCAASGEQGVVKVYKTSAAATQIFATGYNTCDTTNTRRIERGLKIVY
jgi:Tfp pilus assembly protein PilX